MSKQIHQYNAAVSIDAAADFLLIDPASSGAYNKISRNVLLGLSSAPVGLTDSQSPTNKVFDNTNSITVKDGSLTIQNSSSTTKQAVFSASGITAGQTRTFTFPDASGTLVTTGATQTLTAKTITSPTITGGTYDNGTITVDSISGHTVATTVTVANLQISNGVLNTNNSVVTANLTDGAVTPAKLLTGTGTGWALSTWSPTWANLTVGNGTITAHYIQVGKQVFYWLTLVFGTTTVVTGSAPTYTLPVTTYAFPASALTVMPIGRGGLTRQGSATYLVDVVLTDSTHAKWLTLNTSGTSYLDVGTDVSSTVMATWASTDVWTAQAWYEAA